MKKIIYILCLMTLATSCSEFLERTPSAEIGSADYFKDESSLEIYANGFVQSYTPSAKTIATGDGNSDIVATVNSSTFLTSPSWTAEQQTGWDDSNWKAISNINYFLENFRKANGVSAATFNHFEGTARFWRAYQYYSKVRTFGAVPWYDFVISPDDKEALYKTQDSREFVVSKIIEDLQFACKNLYDSGDWIGNAQINRHIALAFLSRVALYEGTFRKYHSVDPSTNLAWSGEQTSEELLRISADAAEELMNTGAYSIATGSVQSAYRSLFTSNDLNRKEVIWGREMSESLSIFHNLTWLFTSGSMGERWSLDDDFANTFLNLDGSRYTDSSSYNSEGYIEECAGRDYRLSQIAITPSYSKLIDGVSKPTPPNFAITLTGYQVMKYNLDDDAYESATISTNSLPIIRYAEVLLNYAEAKAELGEFNESIWNKTIKPLRERAGVNGTIPTTIDTYLQDYYGTLGLELLEIRRERAIELLLEGQRYDDLMRWKMGDKLNKQWYGIYVPALKAPMDLNGDGTNDVCFVASTSDVGNENGVAYIVLSDAITLENGTSGRLIYNVTRYFDDTRYLRPIPRSATKINPNLVQNYSWR